MRYSSEIPNGLKLFRLVYDKGGEICRKVLRTKYPDDSSLTAALSNRRQLFKTLKNSKVIFKEQMDLLYPTQGLPDIEKFDISLLVIVLRNLPGLPPPPSSLDWKIDELLSSDRSTAANLLRIKKLRHQVAHSCKTGVSPQEFESRWNEISVVLMELGMDRSEITHLKEAPLDEESYNKLQREVQIILEELNKDLEKVKQNTEEILEMVKNGQKVIKLCEISVYVDDSKIIGKGTGFKGTSVYHGTLNRTGEHVAVKRMFSGIFDYKKALDFKALQHPNIIRCFAVEEKDEFLYLALELCDKNLAVSLAEGDFLSRVVPSRLQCLAQVTEAILYLHGKGVCHGDIKPANILVTLADNAGLRRFVLADINISKKELGKTFSSKTPVVGDIGWLPKESYQPYLQVDPSWDIFSLGCVFYYMLTNMKHPFGNANNLEACQKNIQYGKMADLKAEDFVEFSNLKSLISSMVDHSPDKRPCITEVRENIVGLQEEREPAD